MPISDAVVPPIQAQLAVELESHQRFLAFAMCANSQGFFGVEKYFRKHSHEEGKDWKGLAKFLNDFDKGIFVPACPAIDIDVTTPIQELFTTALELEQTATAAFNNICHIADTGSDYVTSNFIQKYLKNQRKEEVELRDILHRLALAGDDLILFDKWMKHA